MIIIYLVSTAIYLLMPGGGLEMSSMYTEEALPDIPDVVLTLANMGMIAAIYFPVGLLGIYLNKKTNLPAIFKEDDHSSNLFLRPMITGLILGVVLVLFDLLTKSFGISTGLTHPPFPSSILASLNAGIGEEIVFRLFLMSLCIWILSWIRDKLFPNKISRGVILYAGIIIAGLAFAAGHFPTIFVLLGTTSFSQIPAILIIEVIVLNMLVGIIAGKAFIRSGLVAAAGVHFWADIVWHVIYGLFV